MLNNIRYYAFRSAYSSFVTGYICAVLDIALVAAIWFIIVK